MSVIRLKKFIKRNIYQIKQGGRKVLVRKIKLLFGLFFRGLFNTPLYILAIPAVLIMRIIKPWLLVRLGRLISSRIGHFAANTELYLCERDAGINVPNQPHIDVFYMPLKPICNQQLAIMWHRVLRIWPAWILEPINVVNLLIPGGKSHEIDNNTQGDRDVHNLLDQIPPHLQVTTEEEIRGEAGLRSMGIPIGAPFVCLTVRDNAYLAAHLAHGNSDPFNYHNYRDSDVQNYVLAAEALADRGFFVIRMGAKVHAAINSTHPKVLDYATNDMRSDFMDIYLGAKCAFCISVGTGFDAVPLIFRRPIAYVNMVPAGYLFTFSDQFVGIFKHHLDADSKRELSLSEIFARGVGFCVHTSDYETKGVDLNENTPEEIRDVAIEMAERLADTWQAHPDDEALQQRFWEIFPTDAVDIDKG
ncbi:MAG: TIGR04372 family glycosyltransferase, partial [Gammaproteobacteria bacterium]|nr:TIGR04372 family glycosyltransferase [Gammaproteobacteria bacterium]